PTEEFISRTRSSCVIALHGLKDTIILPHHTEWLMRAVTPSVTLRRVLIPEADHNDLLSKGVHDIEEALVSCLE
ncbi:MAG: hypothetical protein EBZ48_06795, partial [Proteobacteria bacterium]|nr:hypothetical protein [Pseudomonadota bacterium]